jgi:hypothetical protein
LTSTSFCAFHCALRRSRAPLKWSAARFGFPNAEVFPKQDKLDDATQCGNGINLPFFAGAADFANFNPHLFSAPTAEWPQAAEEIAPRSVPNKEDDGEPGYWEQDALLALLQAFQKRMPEFRFRPCRHGYSVPCPGNLPDGWPDGARHSTEDRLLTHETLVWLRNGWPVFRCVHAHCDGGAGEPKKTWKDFIEYYDPLRLFFDFDEWQEQALNLAADQCWSGSVTSNQSLSHPESALPGDDDSRGGQ